MTFVSHLLNLGVIMDWIFNDPIHIHFGSK